MEVSIGDTRRNPSSTTARIRSEYDFHWIAPSCSRSLASCAEGNRYSDSTRALQLGIHLPPHVRLPCLPWCSVVHALIKTTSFITIPRPGLRIWYCIRQRTPLVIVVSFIRLSFHLALPPLIDPPRDSLVSRVAFSAHLLTHSSPPSSSPHLLGRQFYNGFFFLLASPSCRVPR